ncbi:MAG: OmpA family protein [Polyangiaceae bacterium]
MAPDGDVESYSGDGSLRVAPRILASGDVSFFTYAARLGFVVRERNDRYADSPVGSELTFAAAAGVRLFRSLVIGPEVFGGSVVTGDTTLANGNTQTTALDTLLGAHYTLGALRFGAGVGAGLTRGFGSPVARSVLHVEWSPDVPLPEFHDKDADGIADEDDACPTVGGYHTGDPRTNGCPEPVHDRDKDGIVDELDVCPDLAGIRSVDPKSNGCPPDRDGDTVADAEDACPDVQGVRAADPKKSGCPADSDADGVVDSADACPNEAGLTTTDPKTNGCPDPDRDKDGIPNADDACPDEAGKVDPDPKRSGCPKAFVREGQIRILDQVKFKTGSAAIQPGKDSQEVLDAVLRILKDHSEITKLRVEGHTDDKGAAATNKKLSANRAAAVVQWLVAHGIEASRLSSTGLGSDKPLVPNDTADGRTQNRRVEFHIEGPASGS